MAQARLYCLTNPYMPGLVKIGFTRRSVRERMVELSFGGWGTSATGVPGAFELVKAWDVDFERAEAIEGRVHQELGEHRVKAHRGRRAREFFHLEPAHAVVLVEEVLQRMDAVRPPPPRPIVPAPAPRRPPAPPVAAPTPMAVGNPTLGPWLLLAFVAFLVWLLVPH